MKRGSLTIVGTGLALAGQVTQEALSAIEQADGLLYLVSDIVTSRWLEGLNPAARSLYDAYAEGRRRDQAYAEIVPRILGRVRAGGRPSSLDGGGNRPPPHAWGRDGVGGQPPETWSILSLTPPVPRCP